MTEERNQDPFVHDVEILLRLLFDYTDAQIAEVWERQLIPNAVVDGRRQAALEPALAFLEQIGAAKLAEDAERYRALRQET